MIGEHEVLLRQGLERLSVPADQVRRDALVTYIQEIELWNPAYGLVKADIRGLVVDHVLDSLAVLPVLAAEGVLRADEHGYRCGDGAGEVCFADVGSGAGLPGLPLSLFLPSCRGDLIESSGKRCAFLRNAAALLKVGGRVSVLEKRVEEADLSRGPYYLTLFRAFKPLSKALGPVFKITKPGGWIAAYGGTRLKVEEELSVFFKDRPAREPETVKIISLSVPFSSKERCLCLIHI